MGRPGKSEVGNVPLLRAASQLLQLLGHHDMPDFLDVQHGIQPVFDLSTLQQPVAATGSVGAALDGLATLVQPLVGNGTIAGTVVVNNQAGTNALDTRIDTAALVLTFDAAGALAFNGKAVQLELVMVDQRNPAIGARLMELRPWIIVATAQLQYVWTLWGFREALQAANQFGITGWPAFIQGDIRLDAIITSVDGTNFPANTLSTWGIIGRQTTKNSGGPY